MATDLLDPRVRDLLERERALLSRLHRLLEQVGRTDDARRVADAAAALSEAFLVVVVGEFNAGKSSVVNALFGEKLMEEGPIPTTAKITLVRHGEERSERLISQYLLERRIPSELLRALTLVDTPGTNSIVAEHQRLTEDFIPRADLVLFVTSYDRPLTESEMTFLSYIRGDWGKQFVCVINKADLARSEDDLKQVIQHVQNGLEDRFGFRPTIFALSAALAYESKTNPSDVVRATLGPQSRFEPFERYARETLAGPDRVAYKLGGPLDAAAAQIGALDAPLAEREAKLGAARDKIGALRAHLTATEGALHDSYVRPLDEIDALLEDMRLRGVRFLEDAFRVSNLGLLRDKDRFKEEFQRQVVRDLDREIETRVASGVDAMQTRALGLWQQALTGLRDALPPTAPGDTGFDRTRAFAELEREANRQMRLHDVREEARHLLEAAQQSADLTQYLGVGAAGLGVLGAVLIVATTADAVGGLGLFTAAAAGIAGLTVLPVQREKAVGQFNERVETLKRDLRAALDAQFREQAGTVAGRVGQMLAPLEAEAQKEADTVGAMLHDRDSLRGEIETLRRDIGRVGTEPPAGWTDGAAALPVPPATPVLGTVVPVETAPEPPMRLDAEVVRPAEATPGARPGVAVLPEPPRALPPASPPADASPDTPPHDADDDIPSGWVH